MFYGPVVFDPLLIIAQASTRHRRAASPSGRPASPRAQPHALSQIVAVQSLFYISLGFLLLLTLGANRGAARRACVPAHAAAPSPRPRRACVRRALPVLLLRLCSRERALAGGVVRPLGLGARALERALSPSRAQDGDCSTPGERGARVRPALPRRRAGGRLRRHCVRAAYLSFVVERAKKCLDFTLTLYLIHLACCCAYRGWPRSPEWWALNLTSAAVMAALGEWLCLRKEMREIPITSGGGGGAPAGRSRSGGSAGLQMTSGPFHSQPLQRAASE